MSWEGTTMPLKTSWFSKTLFIKNVTRFWPVWAAYTLIWLFIMPLNLQSLISANTVYGQARDVIEDLIKRHLIYRYLDTGLDMAIIFGILAAMAVFSYLYAGRSAGLIHMLPVRREGLFVTNYISGLSFLVLPNVAVLLVSAVLLGLNGFAVPGALWSWFGVMTSMTVLFYAFGVFCAMFTGHILALPVFYGILNFLAICLEELIELVLGRFIFGMAPNRQLVLGFLSPYYKYDELITGTYDSQIEGWGVIIGYAAAGIVLSVLALLIYRKRHVETAGDIVAVKPVKPVFKYGVAFCFALVFGLILYTTFEDAGTAKSIWLLLGCMLPSGFVGYYAAEMLLKKSFRVIKSGLRGWLVFSLVLVVLTLTAKLDIFGYERRVPKAAEVKEAYVGMHASYYGNVAARYYNNRNGVVSDGPEDIRDIIRLHELIVKNRAAIERANEREVLQNGSYASVDILYLMNDGRMMNRSYSIPVTDALLKQADSPAAAYDELLNSPENIQSRHFPDGLTMLNFGNCIVNPNYPAPPEDMPGYIILSQEEAYTLYKAVIQDMREGRIGKMHLYRNDELMDSLYTCTISFQLTGDFSGWIGYSGADRMPEYIDVTLTLEKDSVHTIAALKELGVLDESLLATEKEAEEYYYAQRKYIG
jgi:ABC-2 type transport system permease protein